MSVALGAPGRPGDTQASPVAPWRRPGGMLANGDVTVGRHSGSVAQRRLSAQSVPQTHPRRVFVNGLRIANISLTSTCAVVLSRSGTSTSGELRSPGHCAMRFATWDHAISRADCPGVFERARSAARSDDGRRRVSSASCVHAGAIQVRGRTSLRAAASPNHARLHARKRPRGEGVGAWRTTATSGHRSALQYCESAYRARFDNGLSLQREPGVLWPSWNAG